MAIDSAVWTSLAVAATAFTPCLTYRPQPPAAGHAPRRSALILNGAALAGVKDKLGAEEGEVVFRTIDELAFTIETGAVGVYETASNRDLADFAFVQVASFPNPTGTLLNAIADYLRHHGVHVVNAEGIGAPTRLLQYVRLAQAGMPVPATRYLPPRLLADSYADLAERFGLPFILTPLRGVAGRRDLLVSGEPGFAERLATAQHASFLARELIPADATYRLLVLGHEVSVVLRQVTSFGEADLPGTPDRRQVSLVNPATFSPSARILGIQAASLMELDVADVHVVRHWLTGEWHVLETSATPRLSAGAFVPDKVSAYTAYLQRKLGAGAGSDCRSW